MLKTWSNFTIQTDTINYTLYHNYKLISKIKNMEVSATNKPLGFIFIYLCYSLIIIRLSENGDGGNVFLSL